MCLGQVLFAEQLTKSWGSGASPELCGPHIFQSMSAHTASLSKGVFCLFLHLSICLFVFSSNL